MARYSIHMINSEFESREDEDYPTLDEARRMGVIAATKVVSEAIVNGEQTSAVEVRIEDAERVLAHCVVNLSVSNLLND